MDQTDVTDILHADRSCWTVFLIFLRLDAVSSGSLVFGGGHVVLPLLQADLVPSGWVDHDAFLAGYGAAQAVPGPLFTFAAFLGASMNQTPSGWSRWQSVAPLR
ncbi:hypothetical protein WR25_02997 [Diploscapter pachys]|uniref:Chromate transporter n=1 Tax=Diploscapter pachys TaxID=2018661 RepID=A0A2A2K3N1_9BILA|nr:hypothetical protein WR25_02997 [Diploscapter pachys]